MKPKWATIDSGFPLAAVVLLVTTVAALLACIDMRKVREELQRVEPDADFFVGLTVVFTLGAVVGGVMGLMRPRRLGGFFLGGAVGGLTSLILLPLAFAPANLWQCLAAAGMLIATSVVVRWNAR